jgi:hypothetical protein
VVVVAGPENAATELIEPGVNGYVAASRDPGELARCLLGAVGAGEGLRRSTLEWYLHNRERLSLAGSLTAVEASYASP